MSQTEPNAPSQAHTATALREAMRQLILAHGLLDEAKRPCGSPLSTQHAWALMELRARGPLTVTELASHLNIDRTNVSRLCKRMEELGELVRQPHPNDRRAWLVGLTKRGERIAGELELSSNLYFERVLTQLQDIQPDAIIHALHALSTALYTTSSASPPQ